MGTADLTSPRIFVVGYNAWDVIVPVLDFPVPDSKYEVEEVVLGGGGPAATAAVALARLGARVRLLTPLTDDLPGRLQREELAAAGVDFQQSPILSGHASPLAVILADPTTQQRTIFWSRGRLPHLSPDIVDPAWLERCDMLYTDGHESAVSLRLARAARAAGLPVVFDAGSVREGSRELAAWCTDVVSSARFAPELTGERDPAGALRGLRRLGPSRVAMTCGHDGVLALVEDRPVALAAFAVAVRDTTGAGDAFHAGYAFARAMGETFIEALDLGQAVAALKCTDWGGRRGLPDLARARQLRSSGARRPLGPALTRYAPDGSL